MKNLSRKLSYTLCILLVCVFIGCRPAVKTGTDIEIVKVRDCEYVLWHNSYGSDMEHYEGCENIKHCN